jgi:hypothetical protein
MAYVYLRLVLYGLKHARVPEYIDIIRCTLMVFHLVKMLTFAPFLHNLPLHNLNSTELRKIQE